MRHHTALQPYSYENPLSNTAIAAIVVAGGAAVAGIGYYIYSKSKTGGGGTTPPAPPAPAVHQVGGGVYTVQARQGDSIVVTLPPNTPYSQPQTVGGVTLQSSAGNVFTFTVSGNGGYTILNAVGVNFAPAVIGTVQLIA